MSAKPSRGPWTLHVDPGHPALGIPPRPDAIVDPRGDAIRFACVTVTSPSNDTALANTILAVAAPEMLEALKKEQEWRDREAAGELDDGWDYETMVGQYRRAAIAKAEGRTE